jgi:hypothetical protein
VVSIFGIVSEKLLPHPDISPEMRGVSMVTGASFFQKK